MQVSGSIRSGEPAAPIGSCDLAEGLMLVRASALKIIRLQLAMERHDRHVALAAVDDLVALDRRLQDYLDGVPSTDEHLMFRRELDAERAALNQEKLTLAAGILRRPAASANPPDPIETDDDWLGPRDLPIEPKEPRRRRWWLAMVPIVASGLAAAAYFASMPDVSAWLAQVAGALR